jgi:dihydroxyacid dehydratase/phosphogluconate dehydratase
MQNAFPNVGISGNAFLAPGSNRWLRYLRRNGTELHRLREKSVKDRNILEQLFCGHAIAVVRGTGASFTYAPGLRTPPCCAGRWS